MPAVTSIEIRLQLSTHPPHQLDRLKTPHNDEFWRCLKEFIAAFKTSDPDQCGSCRLPLKHIAIS